MIQDYSFSSESKRMNPGGIVTPYFRNLAFAIRPFLRISKYEDNSESSRPAAVSFSGPGLHGGTRDSNVIREDCTRYHSG